MDESALAEMKKTMTRPELQRITSAGAKYAGTWLTVIPSTYDLLLKDNAMSIAARLRLGLVLQDGLPTRCGCGKVDLSCTNSDHLLCCLYVRRTGVTARHDAVVRAVAKALKKAGGLVLIEKRVLDTVRARPDLDVIIEGRSYLIDIVVTHLLPHLNVG